MKSVFTPIRPSHSRTLLATNSGPLSERMCSGGPWATKRSVRQWSTSSDLSLRATTIARHRRVNSSITVSMRRRPPILGAILHRRPHREPGRVHNPAAPGRSRRVPLGPRRSPARRSLDREVGRRQPVGEGGRVAGEVRRHGPDRPFGGVPVAASPVSAASRSRTDAAIEPPDGIALSWTSFGRVMSAS